MSETTLIVVRHGNTFNPGDVIRRVGARTDLPLTDQGREQGFRLGELLKARRLIPDRVFTAPLLRTRETARQLLAALALPLTPEPLTFLTELDYGQDDGRPEEEVELRLGIVEARAAIRPESSLEELRQAGRAALKRWDRETVLPAGWAQLAPEVPGLRAAWRDFGDRLLRKCPGRTVVAVTSNGIARFAGALLPEPPADGLKLATGAMGLLIHDGDAWQLREWNTRP